MSIYAQAVQTGMEAAATFLDPKGSAAYANAYNAQAARYRAASAKNAAERNISAVRQDKVLTNTKIQIQATQAEAAQKVQAAALGREGQSVDTVLGEVGKTASQMVQANEKSTRQMEESLLSQVNNSHGALLSVQDHEPSFGSELLKNLSSFQFSDLKLTNDLQDHFSSKSSKKKTT